jgi:predicted dehydrogenase
VGAQARAAPVISKLNDIIASGQIGTVVSSTVDLAMSSFQTDIWADSMKYYLDIESGGNSLTIAFGHCKC